MMPDEHAGARVVIWARLLLLLPFVAMLWVPSYDSIEPSLAGVPFFYWYQLAWVVLSGLVIAFVYRLEHRR